MWISIGYPREANFLHLVLMIMPSIAVGGLLNGRTGLANICRPSRCNYNFEFLGQAVLFRSMGLTLLLRKFSESLMRLYLILAIHASNFGSDHSLTVFILFCLQKIRCIHLIYGDFLLLFRRCVNGCKSNQDWTLRALGFNSKLDDGQVNW